MLDPFNTPSGRSVGPYRTDPEVIGNYADVPGSLLSAVEANGTPRGFYVAPHEDVPWYYGRDGRLIHGADHLAPGPVQAGPPLREYLDNLGLRPQVEVPLPVPRPDRGPPLGFGERAMTPQEIRAAQLATALGGPGGASQDYGAQQPQTPEELARWLEAIKQFRGGGAGAVTDLPPLRQAPRSPDDPMMPSPSMGAPLPQDWVQAIQAASSAPVPVPPTAAAPVPEMPAPGVPDVPLVARQDVNRDDAVVPSADAGPVNRPPPLDVIPLPSAAAAEAPPDTAVPGGSPPASPPMSPDAAVPGVEVPPITGKGSASAVLGRPVDMAMPPSPVIPPEADAQGMALPTARPAGHPREYTIQKGDSLWAIAQREYGDGRKWRILYNANRDRIKNPDRIYTGRKLVIPGAPRPRLNPRMQPFT